MYPIIFEIGSFSLRSYGLMAALGFLSAVWMLNLNRDYAKMNFDQVSGLAFGVIIGGILGARLFYVVQFWNDKYSRDWSAILRIDQGGLVYYGGFFMAMVVIFWYCRKHKLNLLRVMDISAPGLVLGHAFGRIGCFLNGCCFGRPGGGVCGVVHPVGSEAFYKYGDIPIHPVQLYEAGMNLLLFPLLFWLVRKTGTGIATAAYLISYGLVRFIDEFFRGDHSSAFLFGMTRAQVIGLLIVPAGIVLLIYSIRQQKNEQTDSDC